MASRAASGPSLPQARSRAPISEYKRMKVECQRILNGYAVDAQWQDVGMAHDDESSLTQHQV
jgi:hypothetical protein